MTATQQESVPAERGATWRSVERELDRTVLSVWGHLMPEIPEVVAARSERRARIVAALGVDGVLTRSQLARYYGADQEDLDGLHQASHLIEPVHMRSTLVQTTFVGLTRLAVASRPTVLAHAVGTAQGRLQCMISPEHWTPMRETAEDTIAPDAVFVTPSGQRVAVEYDRGTYTSKKVVAKLSAFAAQYDGTIWMVPPPVYTRSGRTPVRNRRAFLQSMIATHPLLSRVKKPVHIMLAKWWTDDVVLRE